jgi:ketosteroid isomerase-like protein
MIKEDSMDVRRCIEAFVEVYNQPGSEVYPLYADQLDWIEMPSGRRGGRAELFAALREVRETITDLNLKVISIVADATSGVLESEWSGRKLGDGTPMRVRTLWIFDFEDGKITKEHDYSTPIGAQFGGGVASGGDR